MNNTFDGFIFDIDGTLTATNKLIFASFNHIAKKYLNRTFTDEEIHSLFGPTEDVILKEWCGDKFEEAKEEYYNFYSDNHHIASVHEGMIEILDHLKSKNYPLGIFTGKGRQAALITLQKIDAEKYFDLIVTGDDVTNHKPHAEGILKFVNQFGLNKGKVLMIGDSVGDVKASKEAGVKIASVLWDSHREEKVKTMKSDFYFKTVEELKIFLF
ncbi:MAG: HAD-IA family hydrolase [Ignavibacteria bacterium]|nr:HAD-IA family hydrolase [Ignavibacteria bacterium]